MNILGINYFYHDTSACIVRHGELLSAAEEERFTRAKHTWQFPHKAIERTLAQAGLGFEDITDVAVSIDPRKDWHRKVLFAASLVASSPS